MPDLLTAEWRKIWTGRSWMYLATAGVLLGVIGDAGYLKQALDKPVAARPSGAELTSTLVQGWFVVELIAALVAMLSVTREFGSGAISRSALLSGGRDRLLTAKLLAAAGSGAVFALAAGTAGAVSPWVFLPGHGYHPQWTATTTWTLLGVILVVVSGALWGSLLGMVIRHQAGAIVTLLLSTWLVSGGLQRLVPSVGRFTIDEAMSSIYRGGTAGTLPIPWALVVLAAWIVAIGFAARTLLLRRDLP
jgi:hypothetical protein